MGHRQLLRHGMHNLRNGAWLVGLAAVVLFCIGQWLYDTQTIPRLLDKHALETTTNITIYELQYRQYNDTGALIHFLETPKMRHIPQGDKHILTQPHILITEPNQAPWDIRAEQGIATSKAQTITLTHHVHIVQHKQPEPTHIKTEHLIYYPQTKKATSAEDILFTQGENQLQSKGMIADLIHNHIQLLSNARAYYVKH